MSTETGQAYVIENAPFGGLDQMLEVDETQTHVRDAIRAHMEKHMYIIRSEHGNILVTPKNRGPVDDNTTSYGDLYSEKMYKIDFGTRKVVDAEPMSFEDPNNELYKLLGTGLQKYLNEFFSKDSHFFGNKSNGYWNSYWELNLEQQELTGIITLFAHLFEEGDTFFRDDKSETVKLELGDTSEKSVAEKVITEIMGIERKLVKRLQQHFEEEGTEAIKAVRLALPITQSKIDWDINLTSVVAQLNTAGKQ